MDDATAATDIKTPAPLALRHDTILGVCEGIGEDFGFNPDWLRVALGSIVLFNPVLAAAAYLGLGLVVLASRLLLPNRTRTDGLAAPRVEQQSEVEVRELPLAA